MKRLVCGIIAHVDAGKTTLAEALLYTAGKIRALGRVDHRSTYFDTHEIERDRGITIFSKQAEIEYAGCSITLMDTPGHVDFSAETERVLSVLDCAVLVISGAEGVQAHTETLWQLLERYHIPTFIFISKNDVSTFDRESVISSLSSRLDSGCVDVVAPGAGEQIAMCDEAVLEKYICGEDVSDSDVRDLVSRRKLFPCYVGSGLKLVGVERFLDDLVKYAPEREYPNAFSARVYKIGHDKGGARETFVKITGGELSVRDTVEYRAQGSDEVKSEKVTAIRVYSGAKSSARDRAIAGDICALTGLSATYAGGVIGEAGEDVRAVLEPVMGYRIALPSDVDPRKFILKLRELEEEEPLLRIVWNERFSEIHAQLMGQVQIEVLTRLIGERYGVDVRFCDGRIMYKETVASRVEGVGHFEPLRHYAEVHLTIEPAERGCGIVIDSDCDEDVLAKNWQRLILTHIAEKGHVGVLTGSPLTDVKITLVSGRAHLKHTEGGDFREATYRAIRQGLMCAQNVLLEPYYDFRLEIPSECIGRAISDIIATGGTYEEAEGTPEMSVLVGRAPVSKLGGYASEVAAYSHGRGKLTCRAGGHYPCAEAERVIEEYGYDPEADLANPPSSVFCAHGAGFVVPWNLVPNYMHIPYLGEKIVAEEVAHRSVSIDERELEAIMEREFGPIKRRVYGTPKSSVTPDVKVKKYKKSLYIVDGYNVIFAWEELAAVAEIDLEDARRQLCDILANYKAYTGRDIIVVFDAYNVKGSVERKLDHHGLNVVFTKEDELGDTYIERLVSEIGRDFSVRVVTSDSLIQLQALRSGVLRVSAREFYEEITAVDGEIADILTKMKKGNK
ncbi:MAG: TetM/TetW/TetO/TetS family tetracycline resistance ribosomal protection protein [Clostridia bacterium]|nr:TetM/TetW/TetO/TetS family tetracycline resistance ribosomal protection protein [Clostridia bacterium]